MTLRLSELEYQQLIARREGRDKESCIPANVARESKYHAVLTEAAGMKFASKKEARYYLELVCRQKAGEVLYFHTQIPIRLPGNTKYVVDFQEFHADGSVHYVDVKGRRLPAYIKNKKQVEALYPIRIEEV